MTQPAEITATHRRAVAAANKPFLITAGTQTAAVRTRDDRRSSCLELPGGHGRRPGPWHRSADDRPPGWKPSPRFPAGWIGSNAASRSECLSTYAHTPDALATVLDTLAEVTEGR